MANIVGFLNGKLPGNNSGSQLLFNNDQVPPMNQILKFMRYADVLNDPNKVLQYIINGQLMPEHMEAIKAVFPRLHQAQVEAILNGLTEQGSVKLKLSQRQSLGRFLGTATDHLFSQQFVAKTQGDYAEARKQQQGEKGMNIKFPELGTVNSGAEQL